MTSGGLRAAGIAHPRWGITPFVGVRGTPGGRAPGGVVGVVRGLAGRMSNHWLVKSEPTVYSFAQLQADGRTMWEGVRNALARNFMREMKVGDEVLYYHSQAGKEVVGVARIVGEHRQDPTVPDDPRWVVVDLAPVGPLATPVSLAQFRADPLLADTYLVRQGRLSVMPVSAEQFARVLALGGGVA